MSWAYRCMKCRGRNTLARHIDDYVRVKRCKHCGHTRFYLDKLRQYRTDYCSCEGYHFRHRIGSPMCIENPNYEFNVRVGRLGEDPDAVQFDIAFNNPKLSSGSDIPF